MEMIVVVDTLILRQNYSRTFYTKWCSTTYAIIYVVSNRTDINLFTLKSKTQIFKTIKNEEKK